MEQLFAQHWVQHFSFLKGKKLLLAISGGVDSMVLWHLVQQNHQGLLGIAHCNFQLRAEESEAETHFVQQKANEYKHHCHIHYFDTKALAQQEKISIQMAARQLRYDWFQNLIQTEAYEYVLTAHHLDDQVETFLINFTRSSGLSGFTGMKALQQQIIRPLLVFSREAIVNFAQENKVEWKEDSSNASEKYIRNKIRHQIVPILKELNPYFLDGFQNTLQHLQQSEQLLATTTQNWFQQRLLQQDDWQKLPISELTNEPHFKDYLYAWLQEYGFTAWHDIYRLPYAQSGKMIESTTHQLLKDRDHLLLKKKSLSEKFFLSFDKIPTNVNSLVKIHFSEVTLLQKNEKTTIFVNEDKLLFPLEIRPWQAGDYFYPAGMVGKKKVSKYLKDEKINAFEKEKTVVLVAQNEIVWVIGLRADRRFLANAATQKIIKIDLIP